MEEYRLLYSETSRNQILKLHPELKSVVRTRLDMIKKEPFLGKQLERELSVYRSVRAKRYRIIYKLNEVTRTIEIHYVGHRKDVYELLSGQSALGG
jgi:mRNA-degrading endonuclease RelE of RelBE toxin-antitoxin system